MAVILKQPTQENKGLIVFTHKEWGYFTGNKVVKYLKRNGYLRGVFSKELRQPYASALSRLSERYFIGVHFGFHWPYKFSSNVASFVMSRESNVPEMSERLFRLPFNSREFISQDFRRNNIDKRWDVMTVARDVKFKNYPLLFQSIKRALAERPEMTFLLLTPSQEGVTHDLETRLADLFYNTFTQEEQKKITFLYLHPTLRMGINQSQLIDFYTRARVFTLFSRREGESRVVSEALCCGLPVVSYSKALGGSLDLLNAQNSVLFDDYETAHKAWFEALDQFPDGPLDEPQRETREDYSIDKFKAALMQMYQSYGQTFDGVLDVTDHLDNRLPAHYYDVPWMLDAKKPTADILSKAQFTTFLDSLDKK